MPKKRRGFGWEKKKGNKRRKTPYQPRNQTEEIPERIIKPKPRVGSKEWLRDPTINIGAGTSRIVEDSGSDGSEEEIRDPIINLEAGTSRIVGDRDSVGSEGEERDPTINVGPNTRHIIEDDFNININDNNNNNDVDDGINGPASLDNINDKAINRIEIVYPVGWCGNAVPHDLQEHNAGQLEMVCNYCNALYFKSERNTRRKYNACCNGGKVRLPPLGTYPELLRDLMDGTHPLSKHFLTHIRKYNSSLSFTSVRVSEGGPLPGRGPYVYRIHGRMYHNISSGLRNERGGPPKYAQLYVYDADEALRERMGHNAARDLRGSLLGSLDSLIRQINPFAQSFRLLKDVVDREGEDNVRNAGI